ncbi:MAG: hypothetical protein J7484_01200 [Microbacterium sp.]|nr:hypothetical protein [Microbacterium sp.]
MSRAFFWDMFDDDAAPYDDHPWLHAAVQKVRPYLLEFLTSTHPLRPGPVCPFMPAALRAHQVLFAVGDGSTTARLESRRINTIVRDAWSENRERFRYAALVVLYPESTTDDAISEVQRRAKIDAIRQNLMVGALFPRNNAESVHGSDYYPLRTPVPTIVYRDMVPFDLIFLNEPRFSPHRRAEFLRRYIAQYEDAKYGWEREGIDSARAQLDELQAVVWRRRRLLIGSTMLLTSAGAALVATRIRARRHRP